MTNATDQLLTDELTKFFGTLGQERLSLLVGVSGGADSVALVHLLYEHKKLLNIDRLAIAHVNHRLRGDEADADEAFVKNIAERLDAELFVTKLDGSAAGGDGDGVENWAREERYRFFHEIRARENFTHTATAHTANDQAETLIMRMTRGTGVRGLRGILDKREDGVIRPLLNIERRHLEEWLDARGTAYRTDSTNADVKYGRNFVRTKIIPLMAARNDRAVANISACAANAARAWTIIEQAIDAWTKKHITRVSDHTFHINKEGLTNEPIVAESLISLFVEYGIPVSRLHIDRVLNSAYLTTGEHLLPGGWKFYPTNDRICFVKNI